MEARQKPGAQKTADDLHSHDLVPMKGGAEEHIGVKDGKLNINTATVEQLMALSGIGESKAKSIVEDRAKNGLFSSIEDITRVSGIGEAMFNKIKDDITVN